MGFITCSNDELVKVWTYEGEIISTLLGHTMFVFTAQCIKYNNLHSILQSFGRYVTAGEDK
jgi:hypothetical protein